MPLRLHAIDGNARHLIHVDELLLFFLHQIVQRFGDAHLAFAGAARRTDRAEVLHIDVHFLDAGVGGDFERRRRGP